MERAYIDKTQHQALCCWDAPDRAAVEDLFGRAGVETQSIHEVAVYPAN